MTSTMESINLCRKKIKDRDLEQKKLGESRYVVGFTATLKIIYIAINIDSPSIPYFEQVYSSEIEQINMETVSFLKLINLKNVSIADFLLFTIN